MKKFTKVLCGIMGVAFLVAGCSSVPDIKNTSKEVVYNGTAATMVDGYLYYGNTFADYTEFTNDKDYQKNAKKAYLARLNTNIELASKTKDYSPKNVDKVAEEVVGQANGFMFALGNYIYYTTPKREQSENDEGKLVYTFNYSTIYRSRLNGDKKEALYKTEAEIKQIEVLKFSGKYYLVFLAGNKLVKIQLGDKTKTTTLATKVESAVLPKTYEKNKEQSTLDWNGQIFYTYAKEVKDNPDITGSVMAKVSVATGEKADVDFKQGKTISLIARERDTIFYTIDSKTYKLDTNEEGTISVNSENYLYYNAAITGVDLIASNQSIKGYLLKSGDNLVFKTNDGTSVLNCKNGDTALKNVAFVNGRNVYLETETGIYLANLGEVVVENGVAQNVDCTEVVKMTKMKEGEYAFDGDYIYFYAQLENATDEETITDSDANFYLYRTSVGGKGKNAYELLSYTTLKARHS